MSHSLVHADVVEAPSYCRGPVSPHAHTCINNKELSVNLFSRQDTLALSPRISSRVTELILPNGDKYHGMLLGNTPDGSGKYIGADGCTYDGEWRRGMKHGHGKWTWPSGAIYDGEFSGGYMDGNGIYSGSENLTYKGRWRLNLKHGLGFQTFPNGDVFEGSWIQGAIEGHGKYIWASKNIYVGNMKGGKMSRKGTLTWKNGDTYEGYWLDGMMHGFGVYTWVDGGCYIGTWTRGLKDGKGYFYPNGGKIPAREDLYLTALRNRGLIPDIKRQNHGSRILHTSSLNMRIEAGETQVSSTGSSINIPEAHSTKFHQSRTKRVLMERRWSLEAGVEKIIGHDTALESVMKSDKKMVDRDALVLEREYIQGVLISEVLIDNSFLGSSRKLKRCQKRLMKDIKKPGEMIIKGHRSYDLMLSLQLGIRYIVGKIAAIQWREVRLSDFGPKASFWINFPKEGSQITPLHHAENFKWKDYCPMVFRFALAIVIPVLEFWQTFHFMV